MTTSLSSFGKTASGSRLMRLDSSSYHKGKLQKQKEKKYKHTQKTDILIIINTSLPPTLPPFPSSSFSISISWSSATSSSAAPRPDPHCTRTALHYHRRRPCDGNIFIVRSQSMARDLSFNQWPRSRRTGACREHNEREDHYRLSSWGD